MMDFEGSFAEFPYLVKHLGCSQIPVKSKCSSRAEDTTESTTGLGRDTRCCPLAGWNQDTFDDRAVMEAVSKLNGTITALLSSGLLDYLKGKRLSQPVPEREWKSSHLFKRAASLFPEPVINLLCAKTFLSDGGEKNIQFFSRQ